MNDIPSPCFVAYPTGIAVVKVVERGDGGRNLRHEVIDPYVVKDLRTGDEFVLPRRSLFATHKEAAEASAKLRAQYKEKTHGD